MVDVLTRSYDNARSGANIQETSLNPTVVAQGLKKLFNLDVPGDDPRLEAQPLIASQVSMPDGIAHDVIYICTMANNIWAFDANNGQKLWNTPVSLGTPVASTKAIDIYLINKHWGILGTPVIDIDTQIMYVVSWSSPNGMAGQASYRLHARSIVDGSEIHPPLDINASVTSNGVQTSFLPCWQRQRAALLLVPLRQPSNGPSVRKTLFVAFAVIGEGDQGGNGWLLAFDVKTFTQTAAWCTTLQSSPAIAGQRSGSGGIWQGGQGPCADDQGNIYCMTANGAWNGTTQFAESFVKLSYTFPASSSTSGTLSLVDWFTPFRDQDRASTPAYNFKDQDLGSAGPILPPGSGLVLGAGKDGVLYVFDRNNLGKAFADFTKCKSWPIFFTYFPGWTISPTNITDLDVNYGGKTHHLHHSPICWRSSTYGMMLFCWGENENLRAWQLDANGGVSFLAKGNEIASDGCPGLGGMPGGILTLSANGEKDGIVWATAPISGDANKQIVEGILRAYDATSLNNNVIKLLWDSKMIPGNTFNHSKFCPPVVWNGKVYVTTYDGRVDVYGP